MVQFFPLRPDVKCGTRIIQSLDRPVVGAHLSRESAMFDVGGFPRLVYP